MIGNGSILRMAEDSSLLYSSKCDLTAACDGGKQTELIVWLLFGSCVMLLTTRHTELKSYAFHYNTSSCFLFSSI